METEYLDEEQVISLYNKVRTGKKTWPTGIWSSPAALQYAVTGSPSSTRCGAHDCTNTWEARSAAWAGSHKGLAAWPIMFTFWSA